MHTGTALSMIQRARRTCMGCHYAAQILPQCKVVWLGGWVRWGGGGGGGGGGGICDARVTINIHTLTYSHTKRQPR